MADLFDRPANALVIYTGDDRSSQPPIVVEDLSRALAAAEAPEQVIQIETQLDLAERFMRESGLYTAEQIRRVNALRMRARWKLGRLLAAVTRGQPAPGTASQPVTWFRGVLEKLGLDRMTAVRAQRIGALPEPELEKALSEAGSKGDGFFASFAYLLDRARPYWYAASRKQKHETIRQNAMSAIPDAEIGPFPLIYADPPWKFNVYSEKGLDRTPDQHYETLTDEEIINFKVGERTVPQLAHKDAALLLWCTSSNLERALAIMHGWDFTFKTSAVWDKGVTGLGLVFRNQHEVLLYGTRGNMPGPQYQPPSVFRYPRGKHSAKPPEIRSEIERMYPDFNERTRLELFARDAPTGWTARGLEAH